MISSAAFCLSSVSDQSAAALYKLINLFIVNPYMSTVYPLPILCIFPGLSVEIVNLTVRVSRGDGSLANFSDKSWPFFMKFCLQHLFKHYI